MRIKYEVCEACGELRYSPLEKKCKYCGYSENYASSWRVIKRGKEAGV